LLLLFRMKPTSLGFHSEEQLFSEKDESSERFDGLNFNTPCCLFRLAPTAGGVKICQRQIPIFGGEGFRCKAGETVVS